MDMSTSSYSYGTLAVDVSHLRGRDIEQVMDVIDPIICEAQDKVCPICHGGLTETIYAFYLDRREPIFICSYCFHQVNLWNFNAETMQRAANFFSRAW